MGKNLWLNILLFFVFFIFLIGCIESEDLVETSAEKTELVRCGDLDCLLLSASDCLPTTAEIEQEFSTGINDITMVTNFDLNKKGENKCELKMKIIDYRLKFTEEYIDMLGGDVIDLEKSEEEAREMFLRLLGNKKTVCVGEINEIKEYINFISQPLAPESLLDFSIPSFDLDCEDVVDTLNNDLNELPVVEETVYSCLFDKDCPKGICINRKCLTPQSIKDCEDISSSINKQKCIKIIALKNNDVSLCSTIAGEQTYSSIQSDCFGELSVKNNDLTICRTENFKAIKSSSGLSDRLAEECVEKYCAAYGQEGWVWCPDD